MGLTGNKRKEYVNNALKNDEANKKAQTAVRLSLLESAGYLGNELTVRKNTATLTFTKPAEVKAKDAVDVGAVALAFGMTEEEVKAKLGVK